MGLVASRLLLEGPLKKGVGSFLLGGRATYAHLFLPLFDVNNIAYFYDLNTKISYDFDAKNSVFFSGYFGRDNFGYDGRFGFNWGTITATTRWNHIYNPKLFSNTSIIYSRYSYQILAGPKDSGVEIGSHIVDFNLKHDYQFYKNEHSTWKFGLNVIHHTMNPGDLNSTNTDSFNSLNVEKRYALESALYLSNERKLSSQWSLNYGLRFSNFKQLGPGNVYTFNSLGDVILSEVYGQNEQVVNCNGWEPRANATWLINSTSSLKAFYSYAKQYMHLLSNSSCLDQKASSKVYWMPPMSC